ncbi:hypothetical protein JQ631_28750 [Bradyrhizobium manausense]|uniref:hypothetical protein n=1 Tax=Bradyrhizobium manausense TaxID=989370 RepID=UPI001BA9D1F7|nr:hypothetical protein [Bradyrhizobium manausense]MBR0793082.1 hypothetical protein [Bradyrhizobium manausense]
MKRGHSHANTNMHIVWDAAHTANIGLNGVQLSGFVLGQDYYLIWATKKKRADHPLRPAREKPRRIPEFIERLTGPSRSKNEKRQIESF